VGVLGGRWSVVDLQGRRKLKKWSAMDGAWGGEEGSWLFGGVWRGWRVAKIELNTCADTDIDRKWSGGPTWKSMNFESKTTFGLPGNPQYTVVRPCVILILGRDLDSYFG